MKKKISITINEKALVDVDSIIDNIYIRNRSQAIEHLVDKALGENKKAVILCGGPENKLMINEYEFRTTSKIGSMTLIEKAIKKLRENNFKTISIVARQKLLTKIFEILKDGALYGIKVNYIEEKESNGTADSLRLLKGKINTNFLVVYGDIIFDKINLEHLWNEHIRHNSAATLILTTSSRPSEKGNVVVEGNSILAFIQKPKTSDIYLVFSPIFVAEPGIFEYNGSSLEKDVFPQLALKGLLKGHISSEKETHIHNKMDIKKLKS